MEESTAATIVAVVAVALVVIIYCNGYIILL